jgi:hypothetical protein
MKRTAAILALASILPLFLLSGTAQIVVVFLQGTVAGANTGDANCIVLPTPPDKTVTESTTGDTTIAEEPAPEGTGEVTIELVLATFVNTNQPTITRHERPQAQHPGPTNSSTAPGTTTAATHQHGWHHQQSKTTEHASSPDQSFANGDSPAYQSAVLPSSTRQPHMTQPSTPPRIRQPTHRPLIPNPLARPLPTNLRRRTPHRRMQPPRRRRNPRHRRRNPSQRRTRCRLRLRPAQQTLRMGRSRTRRLRLLRTHPARIPNHRNRPPPLRRHPSPIRTISSMAL